MYPLHLSYTYVNILSIVSWFNLVGVILVNQFGFNSSCWWWTHGGVSVPELQQPENGSVENPGKGYYSCEFQRGCFQRQFIQRKYKKKYIFEEFLFMNWTTFMCYNHTMLS